MASSVPPLFPVELAGVVSRYRASERAKRARVPGVFPLELPAGTAFTDLPYTAACERSNPCHRRASPCNPCSPSFSRFSRSCHFSPPPPPPRSPPPTIPPSFCRSQLVLQNHLSYPLCQTPREPAILRLRRFRLLRHGVTYGGKMF